MSTERLLRVEDAAAQLCVSRWTIYRWVEEGRLHATKLGRGSLRIFTESVQDLVADNRICPQATAVETTIGHTARHADALCALELDDLAAEAEPSALVGI
ncbi:MAG: helix-turn-helix domain-containing protein [Nitrospiraceae bacterium]